MKKGVNWVMYFTYHTCLLSRCGRCRWGGRGGGRRSGGSRRRRIRGSTEGVSWGRGGGTGGTGDGGRETRLLDFPLVALVGAGHVVGQGLGAGKVMVAAGGGDDVALAGDLAGEAGDGAGDLVDLAEEGDTGEASVGR